MAAVGAAPPVPGGVTDVVGLTSVLQSAQSPDATLRGQAEQHLQQLRENNHAQFVASLTNELCDDAKPIDTRRLAGLILKNELDAKDEARRNELVQKWVVLNMDLKGNIKQRLLAALGAQVTEVGKVAAQVIAKIASIELARQTWPTLIQSLLQNMGLSPQQHPYLDSLRLCTLETLGFVCEELGDTKENVLDQAEVNSILTAVVQGMRKEEPNADVRHAATCALLNALDFASVNFENEGEQKYIMQMTLEGTQSPDIRTRKASFECIVGIVGAYYAKIPPYMNDIFMATCKAIKGDDESVGLQAIEVWCTISEEEIELMDEDDGQTATSSHMIIKNAAKHLVPVLLETLTKQEEDQLQDEGAWDIAMASGTCLGFIANNIEDDVVPLVWPYVQENIGKPDWRFREAATMAFGTILEGPRCETLAPLVNMALEFLLNSLVNDQNRNVQDTTAWTIGKICAELHGAHMNYTVINTNNLRTIVEVMLRSIRGEPVIAEKVCFVLHNLATGYEDYPGDSSPLSPFFRDIVTALLEVANKPVVGSTKLRYHAYEALNEVIRCSTKDTAGMVLEMINVIVLKLQETLAMPVQTAEDREKQNELQGLLCGVLQVIIQKLSSIDNNVTKQSLMAISDQLMTLFIQVFACRSATVHEEALLAVGALVNAMGEDFLKYMEHTAFFQYVETGLQNFTEYQVCSETVEVVGDLCRALGPKIAPYCDRIMFLLLNDLQAPELHRSVKPSILSCFGDIALAIEGVFEKYLPYALSMLQGAAVLSVQTQQIPTHDEDLLEYNNALRNGILVAYSGIFQGFKSSKQPGVFQTFHEHARNIIAFIEKLCEDPNRDDSVTMSAVWVLGDLADTLENCGPFFAERPFFKNFLDSCKMNERLSDNANWALSRINARMQQH